MATCLNYSSEDVDEEREMEELPGFQPQPLKGTEGQNARSNENGEVGDASILKDVARVWWNSLLKGVVTGYEDLKKREVKERRKDVYTTLSRFFGKQNMLFERTAIPELGMIPSTMHSTILY
nr:hypothetical protein [Tanacetum cinerariifolium]